MAAPNPSEVFTNLDVFCDWSGNPEDPVSITVNIDAWGLPNLKMQILNVQYSHVVKGPSQFIYLKTKQTPSPAKDEFDPDAFPRPAGQKFPVTDPSNNPNDFCNLSDLDGSDFGSVVVNGSHLSRDSDEAPRSPIYPRHRKSASGDSFGPGVDIFGMSPHVDSECALSPKSRKRSAKTASLPDSIPPDDDHAGSRHKLMMTGMDSEDHPLLESPHAFRLSVSSNPTSIPRPAGLSKDCISSERSSGKTSEKILSPKSLKPSLEAPSESSGLVKPPPTAEAKDDTNDSLPDYETPVLSPETSPSKTGRSIDLEIFTGDISDPNPLTEKNLAMRDDRSESLRVCDGSFREAEGSDILSEDPNLSLEVNGSARDFTSITLDRVLPQLMEHSDGPREPSLELEDGIVYFRTPSGIHPQVYQIGVTIEVILRKGKSPDWWELDLRGLPLLAAPESGYLYFRTNPGQGVEFGTAPFKRNTVVENCLMAQFVPGRNLVIPLRTCSAEHYGFINDYRIDSVLHSEIYQESSGFAIQYTAVCSVNLINHTFWSDQCSLRIYVHGGPEGKYSGLFTEQETWSIDGKPRTYNLLLDPAADAEIGISSIELTCPPVAMDMFAVQWEVKVPRGKAVIVPCVKSTYMNDTESKLRNNYDLVDREQYTLATPRMSSHVKTPWETAHMSTTLSSSQSKKSSQPSDSQNGASDSLAEITTTEPIMEVAKKKKLQRLLPFLGQLMWQLIKLLCYGLWILASLNTLYRERDLYWDNVGFRSSGVQTSNISSYDAANATDHSITNTTYTDLEQEAESLASIDMPEIMDDMPEIVDAEVLLSGTQGNAPVSLRDRIDYLLGWRGPAGRD